MDLDLHKALLDVNTSTTSTSTTSVDVLDRPRPEEERRERRRETRHTVLYSLYTVLVYFKPSEAFLVDFLLSKEVVGLESERDLSRSVLAVFTYFRGPALLLCLLLCRCWGCKSVVVLGSLCSLLTTVITVTTKSLPMLQASQALVSFTFASGIAFDALQFNGMTEKKYQLISHFTKGFTLASCCASSFLGQSLREYVGDKFLFTLTLLFEVLALGLSFFLPNQATAPTNKNMNSNTTQAAGLVGDKDRGGVLLQQREEEREQEQEKGGKKQKQKQPNKKQVVWKEIGTLWRALKEGEIFRWTILWTFCYAIHNLVLTNWQVLAQLKLAQSNQVNLNGYALSGGYMMSAVLTLSTSSCDSLYQYRSAIMLGAPLLMGGTLLGMGYGNLLAFYLSFIFFQSVFQVTAAVRNASVAKRMSHLELEEEEAVVDREQQQQHNTTNTTNINTRVNTTFLLSALLWFASVAGVGFEALAQAGMLYAASLSFADELVWKIMAALLSIPLVALALSFRRDSFLRAQHMPK